LDNKRAEARKKATTASQDAELKCQQSLLHKEI
jgi:hypothetical protein